MDTVEQWQCVRQKFETQRYAHNKPWVELINRTEQNNYMVCADQQGYTHAINVRQLHAMVTISVRQVYDKCTTSVRQVYDTCTTSVRQVYDKCTTCAPTLYNRHVTSMIPADSGDAKIMFVADMVKFMTTGATLTVFAVTPLRCESWPGSVTAVPH